MGIGAKFGTTVRELQVLNGLGEMPHYKLVNSYVCLQVFPVQLPCPRCPRPLHRYRHQVLAIKSLRATAYPLLPNASIPGSIH